MAVDATALAYFAPVAVFLLIFIVLFAILNKTKILGTNKWVQLFVSLLVASLFVTFAGAEQYAQTVIPWVGVLILSLFFIFLILGFVGKPMESMTKGIGAAFFVILILIFIISAIVVFSGSLGGVGNFLSSWRILGAIILIVISALAAWVLTRK